MTDAEIAMTETDLTPAGLAGLRALCDAATAGPWGVDPDEPTSIYAPEDCETHPVADASCNHTCRDEGITEANARFIAAARSALPALLDALERERAENARLRAALEPFAECETGPGSLPDDIEVRAQTEGMLLSPAAADRMSVSLFDGRYVLDVAIDSLTIGDFRRARAALSPAPQEGT